MFATWDAISAMDRAFNDVMGAPVGSATTRRDMNAATDIVAGENDVTFRLDVPGIKRDDLQLTVDNRVLTIQGIRKYDAKEGEQVLLGRAYGKFSRAFALAEVLDDERVTAQLEDGVLTVRIPKHPMAQPRKIPIAPSAPTKELKG
jgi:HSP20 family protein